MANPQIFPALLEVREAPCEREMGSKKLLAEKDLTTRVAGQIFTETRLWHTKPFSSAPRPKIWAPSEDRDPTVPLLGPGGCPAGRGAGPGGPRGGAAPARPSRGLPGSRTT